MNPDDFNKYDNLPETTQTYTFARVIRPQTGSEMTWELPKPLIEFEAKELLAVVLPDWIVEALGSPDE